MSDTQTKVGDIQKRVKGLQRSEAMRAIRPKVLPESALSQQRRQIMRAGSWSTQSPSMAELIHRIGDWISSPESLILVLQPGPRAETKTAQVVLDLIDLLQSSSSKVAWHFVNTHGKEAIYRDDILKSFSFQFLMQDEELDDTDDLDVDASRLSAIQRKSSWMELLGLILRRYSQGFLVITGDDILASAEASSEPAENIFCLFEDLLRGCQKAGSEIKMVLVSSCPTMLIAAQKSALSTVITVQRPPPPPPHLRHLNIQPRSQTLNWMGVKKHLRGTGRVQRRT